MQSTEFVNLLISSSNYQNNYTNQMQNIINVYPDSSIVLGEVLQNAIDAICNNRLFIKKGKINLIIDIDNASITVKDNGCGFPRNTNLLFLGGSTKNNLQNRKGKLGVGLKTTLFSSCYFSIRSNCGNNQTMWLEIKDADNFTTIQSLNIPNPIPNDPKPLPKVGTEIKYNFRDRNKIVNFIENLVLEYGKDSLLSTLLKYLPNQNYPSPIAYLIASFLRRYTHVGNTHVNTIGQSNYPPNGIDIKIHLHCLDPNKYFNSEVLKWFSHTSSQIFIIPAQYLTIKDAFRDLNLPKNIPFTNIINMPYGPGGINLANTEGFNVRLFKQSSDYELLLQNSAGEVKTSAIEIYRNQLFPKINFLYIAFGRIATFEAFLPNGTQRIISSNGTPTRDILNISKGKHQQYVQCLDLIIDIQDNLNYGKTHLIDHQLVKLINDYINDAYVAVLQKAISAWVAQPEPSLTGTGMPQNSFRISQPNLSLANYAVFKEPYGEQDVIALFFEMIGRGVFQSPFFRSYGISIHETYDGRGLLIPNSQTAFPQVNNDTQLQIIEFKVNASDIIIDFEQGTKDIKSVNLVICWEYGNFSPPYALFDTSLVVPPHQFPLLYPKVTKVISDSKGTLLQVICLREIRDQLIHLR